MHNAYAQALATYPLQRYSIAGHRWEWITAGSGDPPLLMLPGGFGMAQTSWQYLLALHSLTRVIALHYPPQIATLAELSDQLALLLDHLQIRQAHVLGGSASGVVAQVFVRRHPERVATLILAQTSAPHPQRAWLAQCCAAICTAAPLPLLYALLRLAIYGFLPRNTPAQRFWRAHFAAVLAAQSRAALVNRFRLAADFDANYVFTPSDLRAWLGTIAILESTTDRIIPATARAALRTLYPGAQVIAIPGSHGTSVEAPEQQISALRALLAQPIG